MNLFIIVIGKILCKLDGIKYRYKRYKNLQDLGVQKNSSVQLGAAVTLSHPENITIGEGTYINGGDILASKEGKITIGKNCLISYNVHMRTDMHAYMDKEVSINEQGHVQKDIIIGDDVWIGYGVQIMSGVNIADGCVIGAGAIVTKDTEPYGVYVGIPAKCIKKRKYTKAFHRRNKQGEALGKSRCR